MSSELFKNLVRLEGHFNRSFGQSDRRDEIQEVIGARALNGSRDQWGPITPSPKLRTVTATTPMTEPLPVLTPKPSALSQEFFSFSMSQGSGLSSFLAWAGANQVVVATSVAGIIVIWYMSSWLGTRRSRAIHSPPAFQRNGHARHDENVEWRTRDHDASSFEYSPHDDGPTKWRYVDDNGSEASLFPPVRISSKTSSFSLGKSINHAATLSRHSRHKPPRQKSWPSLASLVVTCLALTVFLYVVYLNTRTRTGDQRTLSGGKSRR